MLQALLANRFKLVVRRETRRLPSYALVRARADGAAGPQLRPTAAECIQFQGGRAVTPPDSKAVVCGLRPAGPDRILLVAARFRNSRGCSR